MHFHHLIFDIFHQKPKRGRIFTCWWKLISFFMFVIFFIDFSFLNHRMYLRAVGLVQAWVSCVAMINDILDPGGAGESSRWRITTFGKTDQRNERGLSNNRTGSNLAIQIGATDGAEKPVNSARCTLHRIPYKQLHGRASLGAAKSATIRWRSTWAALG